MNDDRLRAELRRMAAREAGVATFDDVMAATPRRWRVRRARAALLVLLIAALAFATLRTSREETYQFAALKLPQRTDWLLDLPDSDWLGRALLHTGKEKPDAN